MRVHGRRCSSMACGCTPGARRLTSTAMIVTGHSFGGAAGLLISGKQDHTVPDVSTRSTLKQYRDSTAVTELKQFGGCAASSDAAHPPAEA
jgi:hypothetical protein